MYALEMILACMVVFRFQGWFVCFVCSAVYEAKIVLRVSVPMTVLARGILLAINDHYAGDANQNMSIVKHEYKILHFMFQHYL
jgi:hypothetical protein